VDELTLQLNLSKPFLTSSYQVALGHVTWLVGPNGSGKTKLAEALVNSLGGPNAVRLLRADRLAGMELNRSGYFYSGHFNQGFNKNQFEHLKNEALQHGYGADAIILLEEDRALRAIVEATLSQVFSRRVIFEWDSGILQPKVLLKGGGDSYSLHQHECHGLKELVVLLTHLHDRSKTVLIVDEPELNLHPQFQCYILEQFVAVAKLFNKRIVLITHSPYMLDIKTEEDLKYVYCFKAGGKLPSRVSTISGISLSRIRRCISQMNSHHRQVFFAEYVVIVEGVNDRLVLAGLLGGSNKSIAAAGGTIIDVNGKDDIPFYLKFCEQLGKDVYVFADLDGLFDGSIRRVLGKENELKQALSDLGGGNDVNGYIGLIQGELHNLIDQVMSITTENDLTRAAKACLLGVDKGPKAQKYLAKVILTEGITAWPSLLQSQVRSLTGRLGLILKAFWKGVKVQFLEGGELEDYLTPDPKAKFSHSDTDKQQLVSNALETLYGSDAASIDAQLPRTSRLRSYLDLLPQKPPVDYWQPMVDLGTEIVQFIQRFANQGDLRQKEQIRTVLNDKYKNINSVVEIMEFNWQEGKEMPKGVSNPPKFNGVLKFSFQGEQKLLAFDQETPVYKIVLSPQAQSVATAEQGP
jgi:hypothetical protein